MKRTKTLIGLLLTLSLLLSSCSGLLQEPVTTPLTGGGTTPSQQTGDPLPASPMEGLPAWVDEAHTGPAHLYFGTGIVDCADADYSYYELSADLEELATLFPTHFTYRSIGQSVLGREIWLGVLGNPNAARCVLVGAAIHGREHMTAMLTMKQLEYYLAYYGSGTHGERSYASLFDEVCFYILPMINPDGVMLSQQGASSITNAAVRQTLESVFYNDRRSGRTEETDFDAYLRTWKANARGVDLNRNFNALWEEYVGVSQPSSSHYKGAASASEPETQAVVRLAESLSGLQTVLCMHSQGEVLYWNCGQEERLAADTLELADAVAAQNGYRVVMEQNNDASMSDWTALVLGVPTVTVETGYGACPLPAAQFERIWTRNFALWALCASRGS